MASSTPLVCCSRALYDTGSGMMRLTLWISTSLSAPAISTPNVNEWRIVIRMPKSTNAMKIDSSVKIVRNFRRQMFFQTSGRNFMPGPS